MKDRALTIGTLVSIKRTGVLIDQQPQLALTYDVDAPGGRQFRGVAREIVGLDEFHVMTPGLVLPVSYDSTKSDDNLKVAQDGDRNVVNAMLPQRQIQSGLLSPMQVQIAERGTSAKCVITGFNPTGEIWQGRSAIELDVRVTRPDGSVFAPGSRTTRTRSPKPSLAWSSTLRTCLVAKKIFSSPPRRTGSGSVHQNQSGWLPTPQFRAGGQSARESRKPSHPLQ